MDIIRVIIIQAVAQVISSETFLTALPITVVAAVAIIPLLTLAAEVQAAAAQAAPVHLEVVVEALHP